MPDENQGNKIAYVQISEQFHDQMRALEQRVRNMEFLNNSYRKLNVAICGNCRHFVYLKDQVHRCELRSKREYVYNLTGSLTKTTYDTIAIDGWCGHHQFEEVITE